VDVVDNPDHCGSCENNCDGAQHVAGVCNGTMCGYAECDAGYNDCNGSKADGCETAGDCTCTPGATQDCYEGPPDAVNHLPCHAGTQTCLASGSQWGPCMGLVFPAEEVCADGIDNDCNGAVDDVQDKDGDGWTVCDGDCCDDVASGNCGTPSLVNPGAFEVAGNMVDDDCDGVADNPVVGCDGALASNSSNAIDYAKAIDICQVTTANPPLSQKKWGVISGGFYLADGTGNPAANSRSIRLGYGTNVAPLGGSQLAVLSSGVAAAQNAPNNTNPAYASFQTGQSMGTSSGAPADWLAANGGNLPNAPGCPDPGSTTAYDPIELQLQVRVPTNAHSFSVSTDFYSSEYPEWVCSPYNDFFLLLLDSAFVPGAGQSPNPADKNLAFYDPPPAGGSVYPVGVNLSYGNTGLFTQCLNGNTGCGAGSTAGTTSVCTGTTQLAGTGFQQAVTGCGTNNLMGGATGWLTTSGNVVPGETITLRFVIWDTSDEIYDSLVLLDNFQWSVDASTPGTILD